MASTWTRITDPVVRSAFREIVELLGASGVKIDLDRLDAKLYSAERSAAQAQEAAYQAIQAAADAQEAADGKIVSYFQPDPPQDASEGDLWFDTDDDNKIYRYTNGTWTEARDEGIPYAIQVAQNAQATADGKIVTYYQNDAPQNASEGDLWFDTDNDNKVYRYTGGVWVEVRDQGIQQALADAANAQATADGKIVSYYQPDPPTGQAVGDLWFDTDSDNRVYRWDGTAWVDARDSGIAQAINDAALAQATADSKIVTYYQPDPPTASAIGDLWVDTDDNNHLYRWNGTAWVSIRDGYIDEVGYTREKLEADLRAGVDLVFKDISTVDTTYPSALVVGNITLNPDGTVAYGSRGVAITKNGLAGFDDSYNGSGDLPSFEIDTLGNATFRGQLAGASGSFAGELQAATGTFTGELQAVTGTFQRLVAGDLATNGVELIDTDINYYRGGQPYTSVKFVKSGVATNGETVTLSGFFDKQPSVIVSPRKLQTYDTNYSANTQTIETSALNLSGDPASGTWTFDASAKLLVTAPTATHNDLLFGTSETETHPAANKSRVTAPLSGFAPGTLSSVEFVCNDFALLDTDYSFITVNLYAVVGLLVSGSWVYYESSVGQFQARDYGYITLSVDTVFTFPSGVAADDFVWGFAVDFVSYDGSSAEDNNFVFGYDRFNFNWTETGHVITAGIKELEGVDLTIHYDSDVVLSPDGTLNWIAIG